MKNVTLPDDVIANLIDAANDRAEQVEDQITSEAFDAEHRVALAGARAGYSHAADVLAEATTKPDRYGPAVVVSSDADDYIVWTLEQLCQYMDRIAQVAPGTRRGLRVHITLDDGASWDAELSRVEWMHNTPGDHRLWLYRAADDSDERLSDEFAIDIGTLVEVKVC